MTEHATPIPLHTIDQLVDTYLDLADQVAQLTAQQAHIKDQLRDLGIGQHKASHATVAVRPPNRYLNVDKAWNMLTPAQQALCTSPDGKKVRSQLPSVLLEQCMEAGKGDPIVSVTP